VIRKAKHVYRPRLLDRVVDVTVGWDMDVNQQESMSTRTIRADWPRRGEIGSILSIWG